MQRAPAELVYQIGNYKLTVRRDGGSLKLRAYSELAGKLLEEELIDGKLPTDLRDLYGDCANIFSLIEEAVRNREVSMADTGQVKFSFRMIVGKMEMSKSISIILKEVGLDQVQQMQNRLTALQATNRRLTELVDRLQINFGTRQLELEADNTTQICSRFLIIEGKRLRVRLGSKGDFPVFLSRTPLKGISLIRITVETPGDIGFGMGIAVAPLKTKMNTHESDGSGVLYVKSSQCYFNGAHVSDGNKKTVSAGDQLEMRVDLANWTIQWNWVYPVSFHVDMLQIPKKSRNYEHYPYIQFNRDFSGVLMLS